MIHYFVVLLIIAVIVIIQLYSFANTRKKINAFLWIFPAKNDAYILDTESEYNRNVKEIQEADYDQTIKLCARYNVDPKKYIFTAIDEHGEKSTYLSDNIENILISKVPKISVISVDHNGYTLQTIVDSINDYLRNNKTVSDFHLMKDIVDRRCDAKEEEINTQIPVPLYMGLVGTMAGILIGIGLLAFSGGLNSLLENENNGVKGIKELLGSVALAMISSILGIILTTWGSNKIKNAKLFVEKDKHDFLSWIQAKLLPTLSDNVVGAIREMSGNLTAFNKEFSDNTSNLGEALAKVNKSYELQTKLLEAVQKIADKDLALKNLELYNVLQRSTEEIGVFSEYLQTSNQYLTNVKELNNKLDEYENRTQFIEKASKFYSRHEHWLGENYDEANRKLTEVVTRYNRAIEDVFNLMKTDIEAKRQELSTFIATQNSALEKSSGDLNKIIKALSELGEVQKGIKAFESAIKGQNAKIDRLAEHIEKLANAKTGGTAVPINQKTPTWQIAIIGIIALCCTILAVQSFIKSGPQADENAEMIQLQVPPPSPAIKDTTTIKDKTAVKDTSRSLEIKDSLKGR